MQKYQKGDHVKVAKDLGPCMSHFKADCEAIVMGSYKDQFGGSDASSYTLFLKGSGECSWYDEDQLNLIEADRSDLLEQWAKERDAEIKQISDLDWIFANGKEVAERPHGASIQALASCFGLTNLWGSRGEGVTYYANARGTLNHAMPFLLANNKAGWLAHVERLKSGIKSTA